MSIFSRQSESEIVRERCPTCREPVPEGATECTMCGSALPSGVAPEDENAPV